MIIRRGDNTVIIRITGSLLAILGSAILAACGSGGSSPDVADTKDGLGIPSGTYAIDTTHAYVTFSYLHQDLSYPLIRATRVDGELELDADDIGNSMTRIAVRADSIRSNTGYFDKELASPKFFNASKYPHMTFIGDDYTSIDGSRGTLSGQITIRGITMPLTLDVTINGAMVNPISKVPTIGISASGSLARSDFGLDRFIPAVADKVDIAIEAEFALGSSERSAAAAQLATTARSGD